MTYIRLFNLFAAVLLLMSCGGGEKESSDTDNPTPHVVTAPFDSTYEAFGSILSQYVVDDRVDYAALKENRSKLDLFISQLAGLTAAQYDAMDSEAQMAMWINAYNGTTLRSIIDAYPVESIKDIDGVWTGRTWQVAGRQVTIDQIEHDILRPEFGDPRVHFAVNCAAISCPPLYPEPFTAENVSALLDSVSVDFAHDTLRNTIDFDARLLRTSQIFDWYGDDFVPQYGPDEDVEGVSDKQIAALNFIADYHTSDKANDIDPTAGWTIEYKDYDWSLNDVTE